MYRNIAKMSDKPQISKASDEIQQKSTAPVDTEITKEKDLLSPEDGTTFKKGRGLLKVPSRSSSQRNQSSPTSTGLSGPTVSDSRNSIGGRSKDSKNSFLGRHRNGSASSNRTGRDTEPSNTPVNSTPTSPVATTQKKKKSGGLLSFFGCCVAPDNANNVEDNNENVHKLDKLPQRPTTAKSRTHTPQEQPKPTEKEPQPPSTTQEAKDKRVSEGSTHDEITVAERENRESKQSIPPAVTVEPPKAQSSDDDPPEEVKPPGSGDVEMREVLTEETEEAPPAPAADDPSTRTIPPPPPPPGPGPAPITHVAITEAGPSAPEPTKWLLPPIAPEFKGKKCLVLDLDETLVHSSFKVRLIVSGP